MKQLKTRICSNPYIRRYLSDDRLKAAISLGGSSAFNLLYAAWEIFCGIWYRSYWFFTLGCYYILLLLTRLVLLGGMGERNQGERSAWRRYRVCGILLLFMNVILSGIVVLAVMDDQGARYAWYFIYVIAAYTFYKVGMAIRGLVKGRSQQDPVLRAARATGFASAVISMLSLEIAMILQFGNDREFFQTMTVATGAGACLVISVMAICMIGKAGKALLSVKKQP